MTLYKLILKPFARTKLNGVVSQMSFHECIKEEWSREAILKTFRVQAKDKFKGN